MDFYDVVKARRSIRSYTLDEVPDDVLNRVMEAVRVAPSGSNRQPWRFLLVRKPALKQRPEMGC
jgi:nitroreductase